MVHSKPGLKRSISGAFWLEHLSLECLICLTDVKHISLLHHIPSKVLLSYLVLH